MNTVGPAASAERQSTGRRCVVVREPLGRTWNDELLTERMEFDYGEFPNGTGVLFDDETAAPVLHQLSNRHLDDEGKFILRADLSFVCELTPNQARAFTLYPGHSSGEAPSRLWWGPEDGAFVLRNSRAAFRLPLVTGHDRNGSRAAETAPAPVLGVCGPDGVWRGSGRFATDLDSLQKRGRLVEDSQLRAEFDIRKVSEEEDAVAGRWRGRLLEMRTQVVESGPLFVDYRVDYLFEEGCYSVRTRLIEGRPYLIVSEESDLPPGGALLLSLHDGFRPDVGIANYWGHMNSYLLGRTDQLSYDANLHLGTIPSHNLENFREIWYGAHRSSEQSLDLIGVFRTNGDKWSRGARIGIYQDQAPDLLLRMDLGRCRREWCLFAISRNDRIDLSLIQGNMRRWPYVYDHETSGGRNMRGSEVEVLEGRWRFENRPHYYIQLMRTRLDESPLDVVRKHHLEWEEIDPRRRPVLWDGHRIRERAAMPPFAEVLGQLEGKADCSQLGSNLTWSDYFALMNRSMLAFLRADRDYASQVKDYMLGYTERMVHDFLTLGGNSPTGLGAYNIGNQLKWLCWFYDLIAPLGVFTPEENSQLRARMAYVAYKLADPNYFPFDRPEGITNWNASRFKAVGVFGMCFPSHPESAGFVQHSVEHFERELEEGVFDSGAYIESTGYQHSVIDPEFAYLLRDHTGFDPFRHRLYRAMFRFFVDMQTPRCPVFGRRTLPAVGDVTWDPPRAFDVLEQAAGGFAEADPDLAGQMVWTAKRGRREDAEQAPVNGFVERLLRQEIGIPEMEPVLESREVEGFGAVLRADVGTPDETYLALKCGASWGHYHMDENSFTLFALGQPLALDSGKLLYGTPEHNRMVSVWAHNTLCVGGRDQTGRRGRIRRFISRPEFDWVMGDAPEAADVSLFRRHILFVKNSYLVIVDDIEPDQDAEFLLHVLASDVAVEPRAAHFTGQHGVDLHALFLRPGAVGLRVEDSPVHGYGTQKRVAAAGRGPMLTVLAPCRCGESLSVRWDENSGRVHVAGGAADDVITLESGALRFQRPARSIDVKLEL